MASLLEEPQDHRALPAGHHRRFAGLRPRLSDPHHDVRRCAPNIAGPRRVGGRGGLPVRPWLHALSGRHVLRRLDAGRPFRPLRPQAGAADLHGRLERRHRHDGRREIELRSVSLLLFGRFLSGLMAGSQPIAQAAVSDLSPEDQRALNMSLLTLALSVGIVLGPVMGGVLSERHHRTLVRLRDAAVDARPRSRPSPSSGSLSASAIPRRPRKKRSTGCAPSGFSRKPSPRPPFARSRSCISCSSSVSASTTP